MDYTPDHTAQEAKRQELIATAAKTLGTEDPELAARFVDAFCQLTPPLKPPMLMHMITAQHGGHRGGQTRKPGNLRLNWRRLLGEFGDLSLTVASAVAVPPLIPFAALSLWNKLWTHSTIALSREHATALVAMWHRRDENHRIHRTKAHDEVNALFTVFTWPLLDAAAFAALLNELVALDCIELKDSDQIWLREWVQTTYN